MITLNKRGGVIIEYVIILAFIAGIALSLNLKDLGSSASNAVNNIATIFGFKDDGNLLASAGNVFEKYLYGNQSSSSVADSSVPFYGSYRCSIQRKDGDGNGQLISLEKNTTYQVVVDLEKLPEGLTKDDLQACVFLWGDTDQPAVFDSHDMSFNGAANAQSHYGFVVNESTKTATFQFSTTENATNFGMNVVLKQNKVTDENKAAVKNNCMNFISLEKVE